MQGHGPKAALLIAAIEYAAVGVSGEENILNLEIGRRFITMDDRDEALDYLVEAQSEIHQRTAGLARALTSGANADPELDRYRTDLSPVSPAKCGVSSTSFAIVGGSATMSRSTT